MKQNEHTPRIDTRKAVIDMLFEQLPNLESAIGLSKVVRAQRIYIVALEAEGIAQNPCDHLYFPKHFLGEKYSGLRENIAGLYTQIYGRKSCIDA